MGIDTLMPSVVFKDRASARRARMDGRVLASMGPMPAPIAKPYLTQPIRDFMTPAPHSIGRDQSLAMAHERMRGWGIRHLPVLEGGKLVGILSQRDALLIETLRDVDPAKVSVEEAMTSDVYLVSPDASLGEVTSAMAEHKYGCAVVMNGTQLTGIFTTIDALRALITLAQRHAS
jgi:acetoin utilization protein AcuB